MKKNKRVYVYDNNKSWIVSSNMMSGYTLLFVANDEKSLEDFIDKARAKNTKNINLDIVHTSALNIMHGSSMRDVEHVYADGTVYFANEPEREWPCDEEDPEEELEEKEYNVLVRYVITKWIPVVARSSSEALNNAEEIAEEEFENIATDEIEEWEAIGWDNE